MPFSGSINSSPESIEIIGRLVDTETWALLAEKDVYWEGEMTAGFGGILESLVLKFKKHIPLCEGTVTEQMANNCVGHGPGAKPGNTTRNEVPCLSIYVPKGVHVYVPLQAYFRINTRDMGQFERTLIVVDEGAYVHYVEGCTAPVYASDSLHAAVVEILVKPGARCRYTTNQNWSNNVYNLVTKRAIAQRDATMEWVDGNLGSKLTMKYPSVYLMEPGAHGEILSIAFAGKGQHQDAGAKVVHCAPNTSSKVVSKSISKDGGRAGYRGLVKVQKGDRS